MALELRASVTERGLNLYLSPNQARVMPNRRWSLELRKNAFFLVSKPLNNQTRPFGVQMLKQRNMGAVNVSHSISLRSPELVALANGKPKGSVALVQYDLEGNDPDVVFSIKFIGDHWFVPMNRPAVKEVKNGQLSLPLDRKQEIQSLVATVVADPTITEAGVLQLFRDVSIEALKLFSVEFLEQELRSRRVLGVVTTGKGAPGPKPSMRARPAS